MRAAAFGATAREGFRATIGLHVQATARDAAHFGHRRAGEMRSPRQITAASGHARHMAISFSVRFPPPSPHGRHALIVFEAGLRERYRRCRAKAAPSLPASTARREAASAGRAAACSSGFLPACQAAQRGDRQPTGGARAHFHSLVA